MRTLSDFQRIWIVLKDKAAKWPDEYIVHERHMGGTYNILSGVQESNNLFARMGYTDLAEITLIDMEDCQRLGGPLTRVEIGDGRRRNVG